MDIDGIPFSAICRTCLHVKEDMKSVRESDIVDMLMYSSSIQVLHGDGMPDFICLQCLRQVNKSFNFKQLCEKSDTTLKQYILEGSLPADFQHQDYLHVGKSDGECESSEKQDLILSPFAEDSELLKSTPFDKLSRQHSDDDDTTGFIDCPELDLEPECNLVENALAALQEDLDRRNEDGKSIEWSKQDFSIESSDFAKPFKFIGTNQSNNKHNQMKKTTCDISDKTFSCSECTEKFTNTEDLTVHMSVHSTDSNMQCNTCNKEFNRMRMLKRHIKIHMSRKAFSCHICSKEFTESGALNRHIKSHSGLVREKKHFCLTCGKGYQDQNYLAIHTRKHTGERPYSCTQCSKTFTDQRLLASHVKTHSQDKLHQCIVCAKRFTHSSSLTTHLRTHTGEKPYACKVCGKKFNQSSNLSLHMRTHTGIKPYMCGICNKSFASSSTLTYHSRTHTGEKPYLCSVCGKSFARSEDVTLHMRTHTGERPYECTICQKRFTTSSHRNQHMLIHTGEKPYVCRVCSKGCVSLAQMRQHILKAHGGVCENPGPEEKKSIEALSDDCLETKNS